MTKMICEKLPETEEEIIEQLKRSGCATKEDVGRFLIGVRKFGCWNEQKADKEYLQKIFPTVKKIATGQIQDFQ